MSLYDRPFSWEVHQRDKTVHVCPCGEYFEQLRGSNMLACNECGEVRWLV